MKIISLLGAFAVLSLMIVPAFSQPSLKGCACMPGDCPGKPAENCCSKSSDNHISTELHLSWPDCVIFWDGILRSRLFLFQQERLAFACQARLANGLTSSSNAGAFSSVFPVAPNNVGPPDPDVVEYLPPSAKQVFLVLASDGPLTQKDIISKTDLPPRTVRYALGRLKGEEMLQERFCFSDARQSLYSLNGMDTR